MIRLTLIFLGVLLCHIDASNILAFFPMALNSHIKPFQPLLYELSRRGHNVTEVSSFPPPPGVDNYTYVYVPHLFNGKLVLPWDFSIYLALIYFFFYKEPFVSNKDTM